MKIATFNCNSIRVRLPIVLDWLERHRPDALALQETKATDRDFPAAAFHAAGWQVVYRGEKSYNGVALVTQTPLDPADVAFGLEDGDGGASETRILRARLPGGVHLINAYVPQGRALDSEHFAFKLEWLARLRRKLDEWYRPDRDQVAWVGDLNVAPSAIDVYDSKKIWPHVCHCREVIDVFKNVADWGWEDVFRKHLPDAGNFTFWDYRFPINLEKNRGWRIDHILATCPLAERSRSCRVDLEPRRAASPSDHTFVVAEFADF